MLRRGIQQQTSSKCSAAMTMMAVQQRYLTEVPFPALSPTMEQGAITEWSKKVGDSLGAGDLWGKVETDKATVDFKNQSDEGFVARLLVDAGSTTLKVGEIIALVVDEKDEIDSDEVKNWKPEPAAPAAEATPAPAATPVAKAAPATPAAAPKAAAPVVGDLERSGPAVHRVAAGLPKEKIASITPTGKDGRFVKADFAGVTSIDYKPTGTLIESPAGGAAPAAAATSTSATGGAAVGGSYTPGAVYNLKISDKAILSKLFAGKSVPKKKKVVEASA